jgi:hypothetical protein
MTKIIAFAGRKQSGKTTCANVVLDFWQKTFPKELTAKIYNFADPLKQDICMNILGLTYDQCYGSDEDKNSLTDIRWENLPGFNIEVDKPTDYDSSGQMTARQILQFVGTDIFRKMKHNIWADATIAKIKKESPSLALIADCRFPNEVKAVKDTGGIVIKLTRNPFNSNHSSETALDIDRYDHSNFDIVLTNHLMDEEKQNFVLVNYLYKKGIFPL